MPQDRNGGASKNCSRYDLLITRSLARTRAFKDADGGLQKAVQGYARALEQLAGAAREMNVAFGQCLQRTNRTTSEDFQRVYAESANYFFKQGKHADQVARLYLTEFSPGVRCAVDETLKEERKVRGRFKKERVAQRDVMREAEKKVVKVGKKDPSQLPDAMMEITALVKCQEEEKRKLVKDCVVLERTLHASVFNFYSRLLDQSESFSSKLLDAETLLKADVRNVGSIKRAQKLPSAVQATVYPKTDRGLRDAVSSVSLVSTPSVPSIGASTADIMDILDGMEASLDDEMWDEDYSGGIEDSDLDTQSIMNGTIRSTVNPVASAKRPTAPATLAAALVRDASPQVSPRPRSMSNARMMPLPPVPTSAATTANGSLGSSNCSTPLPPAPPIPAPGSIQATDSGVEIASKSQEQFVAAPVYVPPPPGSKQVDYQAVVLYDFEAQEVGDLTIYEGDIVAVQTIFEDDQWAQGTCGGQTGNFPLTYVQPL
eukprot:Clim_evm13s237 gene=Clim_evmTU13s237